ncbi:MAG: serine--tRNA ligase [Clostridiales bacterium]|nr:serine--tRNA ligase [Candidatus Apopatousia equi]
MLDINKIRENPRHMEELLAKKGCIVNFDEFLASDREEKRLEQYGNDLKAKRNQASGQVAVIKKNGGDASEIIAEMKKVGDEISENDAKLKELKDKNFDFLAKLPNVPDEDLLGGEKENNQVIDIFGDKPSFDFEPKNHVELCESCGIIDYKRGAKLSGNGYWIYTNVGARLEWAILNFFVSEHLKDNYEFVLPPHQLNYACGFGAGQFPKFKDEVYWVIDENGDADKKFLLPTAETALVNLFAGEILDEKELPRKFFAYTPCYRKEAGSYRSEERGMIRGHQFNKVEMVQYATPSQSDDSFKEMVGKAQNLVKKLGLHHRVSKLAAGDCSASMARTYDIEVWIPSMEIYKEVSSVSNARDYQARRNNTKFKNAETGKNEFVHTLNGSGLATSRIIPAIVEQYQQKDGSIKIPDVLVPFMGGQTVIEPLKK